jgi:hypothetical protein
VVYGLFFFSFPFFLSSFRSVFFSSTAGTFFFFCCFSFFLLIFYFLDCILACWFFLRTHNHFLLVCFFILFGDCVCACACACVCMCMCARVCVLFLLFSYVSMWDEAYSNELKVFGSSSLSLVESVYRMIEVSDSNDQKSTIESTDPPRHEHLLSHALAADKNAFTSRNVHTRQPPRTQTGSMCQKGWEQHKTHAHRKRARANSSACQRSADFAAPPGTTMVRWLCCLSSGSCFSLFFGVRQFVVVVIF